MKESEKKAYQAARSAMDAHTTRERIRIDRERSTRPSVCAERHLPLSKHQMRPIPTVHPPPWSAPRPRSKPPARPWLPFDEWRPACAPSRHVESNSSWSGVPLGGLMSDAVVQDVVQTQGEKAHCFVRPGELNEELARSWEIACGLPAGLPDVSREDRGPHAWQLTTGPEDLLRYVSPEEVLAEREDPSWLEEQHASAPPPARPTMPHGVSVSDVTQAAALVQERDLDSHGWQASPELDRWALGAQMTQHSPLAIAESFLGGAVCEMLTG